MSHYAAVKKAHVHARARGDYTREQRLEAARELVEFDLFSNRQIEKFTGATHKAIGILSGKTDTTGGRITAEALPLILDIFEIQHRGEVSYPAYAKAVDAGVSATTLARLLERPQTSVARYVRRGRGDE